MKYLFTVSILFAVSGLAQAQKQFVVDVTTFKVNGTDADDDTKAIQNCIDYVAAKGGGTVYFPAGTYIISKQNIPGKALCLLAKDNVSLQGQDRNNTILKLADRQPAFSTVISVLNTSNLKIQKLTVDGNYTNQYIINNEHSHGVLIDQGTNITVTDCKLINTPGDGLGIRGVQTVSNNIKVLRCYFDYNQRDGLVLGSGFKNITIANNYFGKKIIHDAIHTEPERGTYFGDVLINNNYVETPHNITIAGSSPDTMARNFTLSNNKFNGSSVYMVYASNITIKNNRIKNSDDRSAFTIFKNCDNILIRNNKLYVYNKPAFTITYSGGRFPSNILIDSNQINFNVGDKPCFELKGCDSLRIIANQINTTNNPKTLVDLSATRNVTAISFSNNQVGYFQNNFSIKSVSNNKIKNLSINNNTFSNKSLISKESNNNSLQNSLFQNNH